MNRLTLSKLKNIAAQKGYEVRFFRGCYKFFKQVADFDSLSEAEEFLTQETTPPTPLVSKPLKPPEPLPPPAPQYDLTAMWQEVLCQISHISTRALIGQMCSLLSFDGQSVLSRCKSSWHDKITTRLPQLQAAFQNVFGRDIHLTLLKDTQQPTKSNFLPITEPTVSPPPAPPRSQTLKIPPNCGYSPLLSAGKYRLLIVDEFIAQGYPQLDGKKYFDLLKTVSLAKILDFYQLSTGMKLSISIPVDINKCWLLNFEIISLAIQSLKDGTYLYVVLQPISRLTAADHYLPIKTEDIF